jgi:hypothetical protein
MLPPLPLFGLDRVYPDRWSRCEALLRLVGGVVVSRVPLADEYDALLREQGIAEVRERLHDIRNIVRHGRADGRERSLFERELQEVIDEAASARGERDETCPDLLLLTVGTSPEPLLLSVAHHHPRAVVLLTALGIDEEDLHELEELWNRVHVQIGQPCFKEVARHDVRDDPGSLFRAVEKVVTDARTQDAQRIVLDFTGAKKTIVSGAFLAAGFLNLETSYVDFDRYDSTLNQPVPGTSEVGEVPHPVKLLKLLEQDQLATGFDDRRYERAAALALELAETAASREVVEILGAESEPWRKRFEGIKAAAETYALWQQGFYSDAAEVFSSASRLPLPPTVGVLAAVWPTRDAHHGEIGKALSEDKVFSTPEIALAYFVDVLTWFDEPTAQRHPRDAYLRLYGASESLISYVFHACITAARDALRIEFKTPPPAAAEGAAPENTTVPRLQPAPPELRPKVLKALYENSAKVWDLLTGRGSSVWTAVSGKLIDGGDTAQRWVELQCSLDAPSDIRDAASRLTTNSSDRFYWRRFTDLRNKAVHWMAPVPPEMAGNLRAFFTEAVRQFVPLAARERLAAMRTTDEGDHRQLAEWTARLLDAAKGDLDPACCPLKFADLLKRIDQVPVDPASPPAVSEVPA